MKRETRARIRAITPFFCGVGVGVFFCALIFAAYSIRQPIQDQAAFWTAVSAVSALIGVIVSVSTLVFSARQNKFALGVTILSKISDAFDTSQIREARSRAVSRLKAGDGNDDSDVNSVLDFFEHVGLLLRRGAIDAEMVWHSFHYWIYHYYHLTRAYRAAERERHPSVWCDLDELYEIVMAYEAKAEARGERRPTESETNEFIRSEESLLLH